MKKGFTMIELIFVIVILGILASVAIPRLAATREDAEISAAVANLRTLVSDVTAYYTAKGEFPTNNTKWNQITNVPLTNAADANANAEGNLKVGNVNDCITVKMVDRTGATPAHIEIAKKSSANGVCAQVLAAEPLKAYFTSKVNGNDSSDGKGRVAIGSSTSVYPPK
ncbi:type II secretion system protein [Campylobacter sp.]|uniref:type II secretion system protein n=1 Tax=Campylobacter sp. TaxID=205 RepID=UPI002A4E62AF|nr:type II secretion system protein [Campylobacter sp.]MDD7091094.1 type II secretion system protein [Campylobacteraceae bacterium]MDY5285743.1 type II secretion system protein [Campylobacter sp.]